MPRVETLCRQRFDLWKKLLLVKKLRLIEIDVSGPVASGLGS
jgi:hypothetical protein